MNPWVSTKSSLVEENERAGAGRDNQTYLARSNSQAANGDGEKNIFPYSADHEQD